MRILLGVFFIFFGLNEGVNVIYDLDAQNPSFIFYGSDVDANSTVTVRLENNTNWVQINGLFLNYNKTFFAINANAMLFDQSDVYNQAQRGLRARGPNIVLNLQKNSTTDFYLSFSIYPGDSQSASLGFDAYQMLLFTGNTSNIPPFYPIQANSTSAAMLTIINQKYSKTSCYEFQFQNPQVKDGCTMSFYAGAAPSTYAALYRIDDVSDSSSYVWPTLSAAYYTFLVKPGCSASFSLINNVPGTTTLSGGGIRGSIVSCEYPGFRYSHQGAVKPIQQVINNTGLSTYPITATPLQAYPGNGGSLGLQVLEKNQVVSSVNITNNTMGSTLSGVGHVLAINWIPGGAGRQGFLLRWQYGPATTNYYSVTKNPLILDNRLFDDLKEKVVLGSNIQVNVQVIKQVGNIYFYNDKIKVSLSELSSKGPRVFQDYVHITQNTGASQFVAAFTGYTNPNDFPGLSDYTLLPATPNTTTTMMINAKNNTQAVTFSQWSIQSMFFGNIQMSDSCEVALYVAGIPPASMADRMQIYRFNKANSQKFIRSNVMSPTATLVVPPNCAFRADIAPQSDGSEASLPDGAQGFVMSPEYPGGYDNFNSFFATRVVRAVFFEDVNIRSRSARFSVKIPFANPGFYGNQRGNLTVTVTETKNSATITNSLNIVDMTANRTMDSNGFMMEVNWYSVSGSQGFLMTYQMEALNSVNSLTFFGLSIILILYHCL